MTDDDLVFKALADPTRRFLLDRLFTRDGRTLTELESELEMTRFGVMKHLRVLEDAGLVVSRRSGRQKLQFLNPVPIRLIHDRWIDSTPSAGSALADLKSEWRRRHDHRGNDHGTIQVFRVSIRRAPRRSGTRSPHPSGPSATATGRRPTTTCARGSYRSWPPRRCSSTGARGGRGGQVARGGSTAPPGADLAHALQPGAEPSPTRLTWEIDEAPTVCTSRSPTTSRRPRHATAVSGKDPQAGGGWPGARRPQVAPRDRRLAAGLRRLTSVRLRFYPPLSTGSERGGRRWRRPRPRRRGSRPR
jgi:DNA-binding transcriptional ArsR family regulator